MAFQVLVFASAIYMLFSCVFGDRGWLSYMDLQRNYTGLEQTVNAIVEKRSFIEGEVRVLRDDNLDMDLLETEARQTLKLVADDEVVVMRDDF